jgi:uncharacterized protein involved in high-affinity Fe2+ transport
MRMSCTYKADGTRKKRPMRPALVLLLVLLPVMAASAAEAAVIGAPVVRDGVEIVPGSEAVVPLDHQPVNLTPDAVALIADVHATKDEAHGFPEHAFIAYLSISFSLTKDGTPTYKKTGLLYPAATKNGPRYIGGADMAGPGIYHLTYIVNPPNAHGMYRQTGKEGAVPDWWKPITASWTFSFPASPNVVSSK